MEYCVLTEPQQGATYDDQLAFARAVERGGFDGFFRSDHYMRIGPGDPGAGPTDAWTTLAGLARETSRIRLGTLVSSATHRVPAILAIQVAQVDAMSGGRVEFGLGTGWYEEEHRAHGIPFPAKRFDRFEEQLAIVTGLWATPAGETFDFAGEHYRIEGSPALPKPVQARIPLIIGGAGPRRTPELAARYATEFNVGFRTDELIAERFDGVRAACERIGRDPATLKLSVVLPTLVGRTGGELQRRADAIGRDVDEFRTGASFVGSPHDIAARVDRLRALGARRVYFQLLDLDDLDQVDELARGVLPG
ncbi:LLM class F420-dependent oxidoreductase [Microbacterium sp. CJ88]|uniref:LLM class F420-dependent oxidoreductase n=1 Tax=Microbacterium sp. CJ88 TaxID=3445672 RepID=UPI003F65AF35